MECVVPVTQNVAREVPVAVRGELHIVAVALHPGHDHADPGPGVERAVQEAQFRLRGEQYAFDLAPIVTPVVVAEHRPTRAALTVKDADD